MKYFVVRTYLDMDGKQNNSIQLYGEEKSAKKRFYSIIASDIDKESIQYELCMIVTGDGVTLETFQIENPVHDQNGEEPAV